MYLPSSSELPHDIVPPFEQALPTGRRIALRRIPLSPFDWQRPSRERRYAAGWRDMSAWTFRPARASEIDTLLAIDDDAGALYAAAGMALELAADDPFVLLERERWSRAAANGDLWLASDAQAEAVGFVALGTVDGRPYLDQLSVRVAAMGRGLGRSLLEHAWSRSAARGELWLTTYRHLRFNRPFYERAGFAVVSEADCGPELREILRIQRRSLPEPAQRMAMARRASALATPR